MRSLSKYLAKRRTQALTDHGHTRHLTHQGEVRTVESLYLAGQQGGHRPNFHCEARGEPLQILELEGINLYHGQLENSLENQTSKEVSASLMQAPSVETTNVRK